MWPFSPISWILTSAFVIDFFIYFGTALISYFKGFISFLSVWRVCVCVAHTCVCVRVRLHDTCIWASTTHYTHVDVRGQLYRTGSLLPHMLWGLIPGCQTCARKFYPLTSLTSLCPSFLSEFFLLYGSCFSTWLQSQDQFVARYPFLSPKQCNTVKRHHGISVALSIVSCCFSYLSTFYTLWQQLLSNA